MVFKHASMEAPAHLYFRSQQGSLQSPAGLQNHRYFVLTGLPFSLLPSCGPWSSSKMAATAEPPQPEVAKPLLGLLNGIAQATYYGNSDITEELLRDQLYPETAAQEFGALLAKMTGIVKSIASADMDSNQLEAFLTAQTKKQGGITSDQAAVIAKFWKNHRVKIRESLINQSKWENTLKNLNWRVDIKSQSRHIDQLNSPVAIVEMELGKSGQESEFLTLEFDEIKLNRMLKKLSEIEDSITSLTQTT